MQYRSGVNGFEVVELQARFLGNSTKLIKPEINDDFLPLSCAPSLRRRGLQSASAIKPWEPGAHGVQRRLLSAGALAVSHELACDARLTRRSLPRTRSQTTLEAYASAVFGKHYPMEAWICPDREAPMARTQYECAQVMHQGDIVWACAVNPHTKTPPAGWQDPSTWAREATEAEMNNNLFDKLKAALPKLKLSTKKLKLSTKKFVMEMPPMA